MRLLTLVSSAVALASFFTPISAAALLAIDLGTDSFKASLVKPGVPFDVLVTKEGRRKTQSLVTLRKDDRSFGGEAANLATRFPQDTFAAVKLLLGHPASHPSAQLHQSLYSLPLGTTSRGAPTISSSQSSYPVEEVLAMQLAYAKEVADETAGESVREVVVTVPGWFSQSERQAVLDAVELAGLRSIGLVNDGAAAAVNYAMTRTFPATPSYHLFYDLGASSLRTTLVSLKSAMLPDPYSLAAKPELKNVTSVTVHGFGFDVDVGGYQLDRIVRDIMVEEVEKKGNEVKGDRRAMAKLLKEASRVKQVLSANTASAARIEGLIEDTDFRSEITREQLESRAADLIPRFTQPIHDALAEAKLTMDDIESVILIGGTSRVPMVQAAVASVVGEDKIAKNVNAEEAPVLGAALYGAGITRGFRTKDIRVQDITPYGIDVSYEADKVTEDAEPRTINTHLFPVLAKTGVKKTMTFKKTSDFAIQFSYRKTGAHGDSLVPDTIFETTINGLSSAFENKTADAIANATVKVTIELNESNIVSVNKAVVIFPEEDPAAFNTFNDKLKGLLGKFGGKDSATADDSAANSDDPDAPKVENPFGDVPEEDKAATKAKLEELMRQNSLQSANSIVRLNRASADSLREAKAAETRKLQREEARNVLEAYIYKVRDLVEDVAFGESSQEHERKVIREKTEAANEWLWDEGESAATKELKAKKSEIEKLVKLVTARATEALSRPSLLTSLHDLLHLATTFHTSATHNDTLTELKKYTTSELDSLKTLVSEAKEWVEGAVKKQEGLKKWEDPVLLVKDLEKRIKDVGKEVEKLRKKKAPRKSKSKETTSATPSGEAKPEETNKEERKKDEL
uniref:Uncharacterized protein n=1 Tax=Leucosporidium scottii TaxID=5278 RepID=A0A0H5GA55_9BASI|nr:hypothetical protein ls5931a1_00047 [Leucosporidium scottii]